MKKGQRSVIYIIAGTCALCILTAFSPLPEQNGEVSEYSLLFMKKAKAPEEMTLISVSPHGSPAVHRGVLFTYASRNAKKVRIAGDFSSWENVPMKKGKNGVWYFFLTQYSKKDLVRYKFNIDGVWIADPVNSEREDDGSGSFVSLARPAVTAESRQAGIRFINDSTVEFRHYDDRANIITVAGDFNNWNPDNDIMRRDGGSIWRLQKRLPKGTYRYKLIIDGQWQPDIYNEKSAGDGIGGVCSVVTVK